MLVKGNSSMRSATGTRSDGILITAVSLGVLALLTAFVYWNSLNGEFVFDDQQIVLQNPNLLNIKSLGDAINAAMGWRQVLFFSYGLNYYLGGLNPYGYHAVNLFLHIINVFLVYFIIRELAGRHRSSTYAAFCGAAVFGVHTLLSGAVSYIAGRSSVMCALFYFLAVYLFAKALDEGAAPSARFIFVVCAGISGLFAWQAKQEAITLPGILAALLWLRSGKREVRYILVLASLPLLFAALMWRELQGLFATVTGNRILVNAGFDTVLPAATYFRTYITAIVSYYFPRFIYPADLSADPHIAAVSSWYSPELLVSVVILGLLVWVVIRRRTTDRLLMAGIAAILVSPLTAYAFVPLADVVLEHRAYIPGLGIGLLAAALFRWLSEQFPAGKVAIPAVIVVVLGMTTIQRNHVYANNVTLWEDAVQKSPKKARAVFNLGAAYQNARRPNDAIREYEAALALKPDIHAAYSNMAAMQIDTGRLDDGEKTLVKLTEIAPEYTEGFINLSVLYIRKKETDKAITAADRALAINPEAFAAHFNRAEALTQKGLYAIALKSYERASYLRPDLSAFKLSLGAAYVRAGDTKAAEKTFMALTTTDVSAEAYRNLGSLFSTTNELDRAVDSLKQAIQARSNYPDAHHDLGILYLRKQQTAAAIEEFRTTLTLQPDYGPAVLNLSLAYQNTGDNKAARQVLESFVARIGNGNSPYKQQVQERLALIK